MSTPLNVLARENERLREHASRLLTENATYRQALERVRAWLVLNVYDGSRSQAARIIDDALAAGSVRDHQDSKGAR